MAITKDKGAIKKYGGGILKVLVVTDAGPVGTEVYTNWLEMGYLQESKISDITENEAVADETGNQVASLEANRVIKFTGLLMQTDKETIDFLKQTVRGAYYSVYHYDGINNGNYQEYLFGICTIKPLVEVATGTKRIPFEMTVLKNEAAISYSDKDGSNTSQAELPAGNFAQGTAITGADAVVIPAGYYYTIQETAI
jgi:hypothetical protein